MNAVLENLKTQLESLLDDISDLEITHADHLSSLDSHRKTSAVNFLHYNSLRQHDLRALQQELTLNGFSSLGGCESAVKASLCSVLNLIYELLKELPSPIFCDIENREQGEMLLKENFRRLFGDRIDSYPGIMVTMPTEAADNPEFIKDCLKNGMTCMRVNCSHDNPDRWYRMISNLRAAVVELKTPCKVLMDLPGPKVRTGKIVNDVIKIKPTRDRYGKIICHGQLIFTDRDIDSELPYVKISHHDFKKLQKGDYFQFDDTRGASRKIRISRFKDDGFLGECIKTAYINKRVKFVHESNDFSFKAEHIASPDPYLFFKEGDQFYLTANVREDRMASFMEKRLPTISCTCPEIFNYINENEKIFFDDGKIEGRIIRIENEIALIEIVRTVPKGAKLKSDKGINLPESNLDLPPLGANDEELLKFIAKYADIVGYSFVQKAENVSNLYEILKKVGGTHLGIILKIETIKAFEELPNLLMEAQKFSSSGVMIARGDLAIECGFVRLSEVQEEILWFAQAMHMPVIWATQVLENLVKNGLPTRAEISDVVLSSRADMVMLNKGPCVHEAIKVIRTINRKISRHQNKKYALMRKLRVANNIRPHHVS